MHEHNDAQPSAAHGHGAHHAVDDAGHVGHTHDKTAPGPCCAMLCLSAMPADLPIVAIPTPAASAAVAVSDRRLTAEAPPRLYRPPIHRLS